MYRLIKHTDLHVVKNVWNTLYNHNTRLTPYQQYSYCSLINEYSAVLKRNHLKNVIYELRDAHDQTVMLIPLLTINGAFSRFSPGGILITETIKFLIENHDYKYFDLSRGDEKYKYAYGGKEHFNYSYEICFEGTE